MVVISGPAARCCGPLQREQSAVRAASLMLIISAVVTFAPTVWAQPEGHPSVDPAAALEHIAEYVKDGLGAYPVDSTRIPRSLEHDGSIRGVPPRDWTSGFFAGILWQLAGVSSGDTFRSAAHNWTTLLERVASRRRDHDLGFRIYNSYGRGWRITGDSVYLPAIIRAADALVSRFNPTVGAIKSWEGDWGGWVYPVIIDNMMNLELLFAATRITGDSTYFRVAERHAATTEEHHFRPDGSSYHVVDFDPGTGTARKRETHQGAYHESAWARGQAWGLYGFTMTYRETRDPRFLERARAIAAFILEHPNLPEDSVPYWDFDAPGIPDANRDASAAAIIASALYELHDHVPGEESVRYKEAADRLVSTLWNNYRVGGDARIVNRGDTEMEDVNPWPFVLDQSVGNMNGPDEVGVPVIYADYYFIEALWRSLALKNH